jgi:hypothetical protein
VTNTTAKTRPDIAVVGVFIGEPEIVLDRSLEEMIFEAARATIEDAGLAVDDLDGVVISGTDQIDGRVISAMVTTGPAAGVGRDVTLIASASEHALIYGYLRLLAGQGRNVLVLAWGKPSESVAPEHAELVAAEPFVLRPHGMNDTVAAAFQASAMIGAGATSPPDGVGSDGFTSWPLTSADSGPRGDAVCGLLLATEDAVPPGASPIWIRGVGWAVDRYDLGDRDLATIPALQSAARQAYAMAKIGNGAPAADAVRVHCPSAFSFGPALAALMLARAAARPVNDPDSGGLPYPTHAAGLAAMALAAQDIRADEYGGSGRLAVGASLHGFAGQGAAVVVLAANKG